MSFIDDYEAQWGVRLSFDDGLRMLSLFDGLVSLFEKYDDDSATAEEVSFLE